MSIRTAVLAVVLLAALSGCMTVSITSEVGSTDQIDRYEMNVSTSTTVYGYLNEAAKADGYESIGESLTSDLAVPADRVEYSEEIEGDTAHLSIEMTDVDPANLSAVTISESDGTLTYEDTTFDNSSATEADPTSELGSEAMSGFVLEYTVVMPNEITESNADEVDGDTATWRRTGGDAFSNTTIHAESDAPSSLSVPGFGIIPAFVALASVSAVYWTRIRS